VPGTSLIPAAPWWTPWPDTGPGNDVLGDLTERRLVELGCGTGTNAAAFASHGAHVDAIDVSQNAIGTARSRWGHLPESAIRLF
jgi:2-polyprenyl-3-methyl-5-hydroxy-6-metoxy-1,4-benzoquinol methylase